MPARFSAAYKAKIRKGLTRYQKERSKLIRSGVTGGTVPPKITLKQLYSENFTRRAMNKALKEMSLFTAGKATKTVEINGKVYSQYEVEKFRLALGRERKATARELAAMQGFDSVSPLSHNQYVKRLEARQKELSQNWQELIGTRAGMEALTKAQRSETFYANWINALFQDAEKLGFPKDKMDKIIEKLNTLTPQQFERMFNEDPSISYIFSFYNAEIKGGGKINNDLALEAFNDLYNRIDRIVERYRNLK